MKKVAFDRRSGWGLRAGAPSMFKAGVWWKFRNLHQKNVEISDSPCLPSGKWNTDQFVGDVWGILISLVSFCCQDKLRFLCFRTPTRKGDLFETETWIDHGYCSGQLLFRSYHRGESRHVRIKRMSAEKNDVFLWCHSMKASAWFRHVHPIVARCYESGTWRNGRRRQGGNFLNQYVAAPFLEGSTIGPNIPMWLC